MRVRGAARLWAAAVAAAGFGLLVCVPPAWAGEASSTEQAPSASAPSEPEPTTDPAPAPAPAPEPEPEPAPDPEPAPESEPKQPPADEAPAEEKETPPADEKQTPPAEEKETPPTEESPSAGTDAPAEAGSKDAEGSVELVPAAPPPPPPPPAAAPPPPPPPPPEPAVITLAATDPSPATSAAAVETPAAEAAHEAAVVGPPAVSFDMPDPLEAPARLALPSAPAVPAPAPAPLDASPRPAATAIEQRCSRPDGRVPLSASCKQALVVAAGLGIPLAALPSTKVQAAIERGAKRIVTARLAARPPPAKKAAKKLPVAHVRPVVLFGLGGLGLSDGNYRPFSGSTQTSRVVALPVPPIGVPAPFAFPEFRLPAPLPRGRHAAPPPARPG